MDVLDLDGLVWSEPFEPGDWSEWRESHDGHRLYEDNQGRYLVVWAGAPYAWKIMPKSWSGYDNWKTVIRGE